MNNVKIATYSDTCKVLEEMVENKTGVPAVVRLGGTMGYSDYPVQINSKYAVQTSTNKIMLNLLLKDKFYILPFIASYGENSTIFTGRASNDDEKFLNKQISRPLDSSGGEGIFIVENDEPMNKEKYLYGRIMTPLVNVTSEYRFFCTKDEVFYIYKKIKRKDNKDDPFITRSNHVIYPLDKCVKPRLLNKMKQACIEVMQATGLDIAALDVVYDSSQNNHKFYILETNTGPEMSSKEIKNIFAQKLSELINNCKGVICVD